MHKIYSSLKGIKIHCFSGRSSYYSYRTSGGFENIISDDGDNECDAYDFWDHEMHFGNLEFTLWTFDFEEEEK